MSERIQLAYPVAKINDKFVDSLKVYASLEVPWRTIWLDSETVGGEFKAYAGYRKPGVWEVFKGEPSNPRARSSGHGQLTGHGLKPLRKVIGPQFFQDADLQTVLKWIGGQVGLPLNLRVQGGVRRHYCLNKESAWDAIEQALRSWRRTDYVGIELDDYSFYIGPEKDSPHATAPTQAVLQHARNIYSLEASRNGARIVAPALPWLRVGHRVELRHPLLSGLVRIADTTLEVNRHDTTTTLKVLRA